MFNWISSLKKSFKHYLLNHDSYTPVSAMTKNDIEKIINKIKEKDESSINENETNHQTIKKYFVSLKVILYLILTICSLLGAIGPGKEFVMDILEKEKINDAVKNLNEVAQNMYYNENSPIVALNTIQKSLSLNNENIDTIYLKTFIESMSSVELLKNLDRPYNEKELLEAQTAFSNADFIYKSNDKNYISKAYLIKAQTYFALNDNKRALKEIDNAISFDSKNSFYKIRKATILVESQKYEEALALLEELNKTTFEVEKDRKNVYLWLGITYRELAARTKILEEKIKYNKLMKENLEESLKLDNKFHIGMMNLGIAYAESDDGDNSNNINDSKKAIELYKKVLELRPNHKETYFLLGKLYGSMDKYEKAEIYFKKALEQDENYFSANLWLGKVYYELEDYESSLKYLNKALFLKPETEAYFMRAEINQKLKNYKEAIKDYLEIDESNDNYYKYRAFLNRANINIEIKNFVNAKNFLDDAEKTKQKLDSNYYKVLFKYFKSSGDFIQAVTAIDKAILESNKLKDSLRFEKAIFLFENNKVNEALEEIKIIKNSNIEKNGLLEKVLKFEYKIYTSTSNTEMIKNLLLEIKKYDPTFK